MSQYDCYLIIIIIRLIIIIIISSSSIITILIVIAIHYTLRSNKPFMVVRKFTAA